MVSINKYENNDHYIKDDINIKGAVYIETTKHNFLYLVRVYDT